ncbi:hypothetical protein [Kaarinaea lacus]
MPALATTFVKNLRDTVGFFRYNSTSQTTLGVIMRSRNEWAMMINHPWQMRQ